MFVKVVTAEAAAKIFGKKQSPPPEGDYSNMEEEGYAEAEAEAPRHLLDTPFAHDEQIPKRAIEVLLVPR